MCLKSHLQSASKAASWVCIGAIEIFATTYAVTGHLNAASGVVGVYLVTKPLVYYAHERLWTLSVFARLFQH